MTKSAGQTIAEQLLSWPEVTRKPHRFGGTAYLYKGKEIGHVHGDHLVDLNFPKPVRDQLVATGRAQPHHILPESSWVSVYIQSNEEVEKAIELMRLKYEILVDRDR